MNKIRRILQIPHLFHQSSPNFPINLKSVRQAS